MFLRGAVMEGTSITFKVPQPVVSSQVVPQLNEKKQVEADGVPVEKKNEQIKKQLEKAVAELNEKLKPTFVSVRFQLHETSHTYFARVVNAETEEVIREIPSEKLLDMHAEMEKLAGLLVDQKM
jgi:flagellar protein FlaG